jgi:RNA polymerase sigma factor (sigma-70 family)
MPDDARSEILELLIASHGAALLLYARQWGDARAEDVVQKAFVRFVRQMDEIDRPIAWLYKVVRNEAITEARSETRRKRREASTAELRQEWYLRNDDDRIDGHEAAEQLRSLPLDQREIVAARIWGGLAFAEIATLTERSKSAVHRDYQAALSALRERLLMPTQPPKVESEATKGTS